MKFSQTIIACLLLISLSGQIQNGSFENWSDTLGSSVPNHWYAQFDPPYQDSLVVKEGSYAALLKQEFVFDSYTTPNLIQFFSGLTGNNDTLYFWLDASDTIVEDQYLIFRLYSKGYQPQDTIEWYLTDTSTQGYELFKIPMNFRQKPKEVKIVFYLYYKYMATADVGAVRIDALSLNDNPLGSQRPSDTEVAIYPVPAHNRLRIKGVTEEEIRKLRFHNLQGQSISVPKVAGDSWQVEHLKPRLYFVEIKLTGGASIIRKFMKK